MQIQIYLLAVEYLCCRRCSPLLVVCVLLFVCVELHTVAACCMLHSSASLHRIQAVAGIKNPEKRRPPLFLIGNFLKSRARTPRFLNEKRVPQRSEVGGVYVASRNQN